MSTIEESIEVEVPVRTAYNQWTQKVRQKRSETRSERSSVASRRTSSASRSSSRVAVAKLAPGAAKSSKT